MEVNYVETNKYIDMSAKEALKLAKDKFLLLSDIKREYVAMTSAMTNMTNK